MGTQPEHMWSQVSADAQSSERQSVQVTIAAGRMPYALPYSDCDLWSSSVHGEVLHSNCMCPAGEREGSKL